MSKHEDEKIDWKWVAFVFLVLIPLSVFALVWAVFIGLAALTGIKWLAEFWV